MTKHLSKFKPVLDELLIQATEGVRQIEVVTKDGSIYRGRRKIKIGSYPYTGDVSFVCYYYKDKNGKEHKINKDKLEMDGYFAITYIPKESIALMKFSIK